MHLLRVDDHRQEEAEVAVDLEQAPGDIVILSFSDNDLGALAGALALRSPVGSIRLASLQRLRHPYSVDLYLERTAVHARFILVRLLGGLDYWRYGVDELARLARARGIDLAIVPGDGRADPRLDEASTVPVADLRRLWNWFRDGGSGNMGSLLGWIDSRLGHPMPWTEPTPVPTAGRYVAAGRTPVEPGGHAVIVFYRAMVLAGDCLPIVALADALAARGLAVTALYATSLKDPDAASRLETMLATVKPDIIVNTTAFSGRGADRDGAAIPSVLDKADVPVIQAILGGASEGTWRANPRGLGPADLAMNVVLPEMDGRLIGPLLSAKAAVEATTALPFSRLVHRPIPDRVAAAADSAAAWVRLRRSLPGDRRIALVLSDYPGRAGREGFAVGLDTPASVSAIAADLAAAGYTIGALPGTADLMAALTSRVGHAPLLDLDRYRSLFATLPALFREAVIARWGDPSGDADVADGAFRLRLLLAGNLVVALQPDRADRHSRKDSYHDGAVPPRHGFIAFYLWLRHELRMDALVHGGTHGTLEWLPGKPVALTNECGPAVLLGATPLVYPFIVNNPGEAAQAKRRNAAVTIGHLTPPLVAAGAEETAAAELEALFDEYAAAQTLDPKRARLIAQAILERAGDTGLAADAGLDASALRDPDRALPLLDGWLCDVKEMRIRDGLHVFGRGADVTCATGERDGLLAALDGRFVAGGPSGAPSRGRTDIVPTGRNLYGTDPRAVPSRTAYALGKRAADAVAERYAQDHGDWPRSLVIDLWASATMRTAGEDLAQAMAHLGVVPTWDGASARVTGFTVLPFASLARPRADVTLRISGLFRDIFPAQIALFDQAVKAVAALDEDDEVNPLAAAARLAGSGAPLRVFGSAPSTFGLGLGATLDGDPMVSREALGDAYLAAGSHAYGGGAAEATPAADAFRERIAAADAFIHVADMVESDMLDAQASVEAEGGFAAAAALLGTRPALYHLDTGDAERPVARTQAEAVSRVVRGRAGNPRWVAGQMRHGHRGAAEIAETVDNLYALAVMSDAVRSRHFDLVFAATVGEPAVRSFLVERNPDAARAIAARFRDAARRGLWTSRRNSDAAMLADMAAVA